MSDQASAVCSCSIKLCDVVTTPTHTLEYVALHRQSVSCQQSDFFSVSLSPSAAHCFWKQQIKPSGSVTSGVITSLPKVCTSAVNNSWLGFYPNPSPTTQLRGSKNVFQEAYYQYYSYSYSYSSYYYYWY